MSNRELSYQITELNNSNKDFSNWVYFIPYSYCFEIDSSLIELKSSLIQLESSLIKLESSLIKLKSSLYKFNQRAHLLKCSLVVFDSSLF